MKLVLTIIAGVALVALGFFGAISFDLVSGKAKPTPGSGRGARAGASAKPQAASRPASKSTVETTESVLGDLRERISGTGVLEPEREVRILARVAGQIEDVGFDVGDTVKAGEVLCRIDEGSLRLAVKTAAVESRKLSEEYERFAELHRQKAASEKELNDALYARNQAENQFEEAELNLSYAQPKAPFDGTIVSRTIELGQQVQVGEELYTLADFRPLLVRLYLPEREVSRVRVGQLVELRASSSNRRYEHLGRVFLISPVVDRQSLTVEVTLRFDDLPAEVRPGSFVKVDIITNTYDNAVLIPRAAIQADDRGSFVYRIEKSIAYRTDIQVGYQNESIAQIVAGLEPGTQVVTAGGLQLKDRNPVEIYRRVPLQPSTYDTRSTGDPDKAEAKNKERASSGRRRS